MADEYFIRMRGRVQGPYSLEKLQAMARRGQVSRFHELSSNQQQWMKAADLKELFETNARQAVARKLNGNLDNTYDIEPAAVETSSHQWFYGDGSEQKGPVDTLTLHRLIQSGSIGPEDEVWCEGMANWAPISDVPRLAGYLPAGAKTSSGGAGSYFRGLLGAKRVAVVSCAALVVMLGGFGLFYFGILSPSGSPFDSDVITSITQYDKFDDAVGKVVWGWDVVSKHGEHFQVPIASGTAFTINAEGVMITNRHVVAEFQQMQRATVEIKKQEFAKRLLEQFTPDKDMKKEDFEKIIEHLRAKLEDDVNEIKPILCVFLHGERYKAEIKFMPDPKYDLAIIESAHGIKTRFRLSAVDTSRLFGTEVQAFGFPGVAAASFSAKEQGARALTKEYSDDMKSFFDKRDLQYYMTDGRVSQVTTEKSSGLRWLQHTADLAQGMSGGPLLGNDATVLGVNTQYVGNSLEKVNRSFSLQQDELRKEIDKNVKGIIWND